MISSSENSFTLTALEEKNTHPLLIIGNFIGEFLRIHPFQDGNGRLSRVLTNLLLLKKDYAYIPYVSHEKLVEDNKENYYIALRRSQKSFGTEKEEITPWLDFFLTTLLKQSEMALELMESEQVEKLLSSAACCLGIYSECFRGYSRRDYEEHKGS